MLQEAFTRHCRSFFFEEGACFLIDCHALLQGTLAHTHDWPAACSLTLPPACSHVGPFTCSYPPPLSCFLYCGLADKMAAQDSESYRTRLSVLCRTYLRRDGMYPLLLR